MAQGGAGCRNGKVTAFVERLGEGPGQRRLSATPAVPDAPVWPEHDLRASDKDSNGHRTPSATGVAERRTWAPGSGFTALGGGSNRAADEIAAD